MNLAILYVIGVVVGLFFAALPGVVAWTRNVDRPAPIWVLVIVSLFLGGGGAFTLAGVLFQLLGVACWIVALVWAFVASGTAPKQVRGRYQGINRPKGYTGAVDLTYKP